MSNDGNRMLVVIVAAAIIVLMALLIFLTWTADTDVIDAVGDFEEYLADHNDDAGKMIITLSALIVVVLALLMIVLELAPEDEEKELRVKQAGATTIVPAAALKARLEEALVAMPAVTAAKARVNSHDRGIQTSLDLKLVAGANVAAVTQDATRIVIDTIQTDLGLPVDGAPKVRVAFGSPKDAAAAPPVPAEAAASAGPMDQPRTSPSQEPRQWSAAPQPPRPAEPEVSPTPESPLSTEPETRPDPSGESHTPPDATADPGGDVPRDPWRGP